MKPLFVAEIGMNAEEGLIRYQVTKTNGGPSYHEWPAVEFVGRMATLRELEQGFSATFSATPIPPPARQPQT
jgi:hypothetical protein